MQAFTGLISFYPLASVRRSLLLHIGVLCIYTPNVKRYFEYPALSSLLYRKFVDYNCLTLRQLPFLFLGFQRPIVSTTMGTRIAPTKLSQTAVVCSWPPTPR